MILAELLITTKRACKTERENDTDLKENDKDTLTDEQAFDHFTVVFEGCITVDSNGDVFHSTCFSFITVSKDSCDDESRHLDCHQSYQSTTRTKGKWTGKHSDAAEDREDSSE